MKRNPDLLAGTILRMERLRQGAEQKAVCYGLCVPSYLCKIEQGAVHPNPDLLSALFRRLGVDYTQDEARLRPLEEAIQDYFTRLEYGLEVQEVYQTLEAQTGVLSHSPLALNWLLVQGCQGKPVLSLLEQLTAAMTDRQRALYKLLRCRADPMAFSPFCPDGPKSSPHNGLRHGRLRKNDSPGRMRPSSGHIPGHQKIAPPDTKPDCCWTEGREGGPGGNRNFGPGDSFQCLWQIAGKAFH